MINICFHDNEKKEKVWQNIPANGGWTEQYVMFFRESTWGLLTSRIKSLASADSSSQSKGKDFDVHISVMAESMPLVNI